MTADEPTHASSDNSGGTAASSADWRSDPDAQQVVDYLRSRGGTATVEDIQYAIDLPYAYLSRVLDRLQDADVVTVATGYSAVQVDLDFPEPRADGGHPPEAYDDVDSSAGLTTEQVCSLLGPQRRRTIIRLLAGFVDGDEYIEVGQLATILAAAEAGCRVIEVTSDQRKRMYISLVQTHLEKLDAAGVITYHERPKKVAVEPSLVVLSDVLNAIKEQLAAADDTHDDEERER